MSVAPHLEYTRRSAARTGQRADCDRRRLRVGYSRLLAVAVAVAVGYRALTVAGSAGWWIVVPLVAFFWIGGRLQAMERRSSRLERSEAYYAQGLARLEGRWAGNGSDGARFLDDRHLYARDLDLFGQGSMFELLCRARTRMGEETLAAWLLSPADPHTVADRQDSVRELAPMLDLREDIAVLGEKTGAGVHAEELKAWGEGPPLLESSWFRPLAVVLSMIGGVTIVAALAYLGALSVEVEFSERFSTLARAYFFLALLFFAGITWRFNRRGEAVFAGAEEAVRDVDLLADVLERLESERFNAGRLALLRAELDTVGRPPSARIARLHRLMDRVDQRRNMFVRLIGPLVLWDVHLAYALEDWRRDSGAGVGRWLRAVGEIEALSSLASYHYERPDDIFPELVAAGPEFAGGAEFVAGGPVFDASDVSHPLLPADEAVANDLVLGADREQVLVVSGSNMSGKSTLLRTVGVTAVLAQAGAPVRARRLRLSPVAVGASIRVSDSLQDGESRFYAEILRLRAIVEAAGRGVEAATTHLPALFLIDEFLHGTNSHDRRIGAEAIVRGLVDRGAIGLVTTHDLALTHIADALGVHGGNIHFEDHLEDGKMSFDYRVRLGVVEKSNALELMRSVGLDV